MSAMAVAVKFIRSILLPFMSQYACLNTETDIAYNTFTKVQYQLLAYTLIRSAYTTHQISDSKTSHARRKIETQMFGHNKNLKLYLIVF
jgi:hypothetical protein